MKYIGKKTRRLDGIALVKGKPVFADDVVLPNMLYLKILHSPHAHAIIKRIDTSKAEKMKGVALILTHKHFMTHYYTILVLTIGDLMIYANRIRKQRESKILIIRKMKMDVGFDGKNEQEKNHTKFF